VYNNGTEVALQGSGGAVVYICFIASRRKKVILQRRAEENICEHGGQELSTARSCGSSLICGKKILSTKFFEENEVYM
jgi:hypothetical protein